MAALCRTADIVGMTTTGAAKNRLMLESLKPIIGNKQLIKFTPIRFSLFAFVCSDRGGSGPRPGIACREFLDTRLPAVDYDRRSSTTAPTCECLPFGERLSTGRVAIRTRFWAESNPFGWMFNTECGPKWRDLSSLPSIHNWRTTTAFTTTPTSLECNVTYVILKNIFSSVVD